MSIREIIDNTRKKMESTLNILLKELQGLRTNRPSPNFLDPVVVEAYGDRLPLSQLATINIQDSRTIIIQVWDQNLTKTVEKAIANAGLGVNPVSESQIIKIVLPTLSEERRKELAKLAHKYGENAKISFRNIRRDSLELIKKLQKDSIISEDDHRKASEQIQKIIDEYTGQIDEKVINKEKEITQL